MDDFQQMPHRLLQRLTAGEIDREEYAWTLGEIERHRSKLAETLNLAYSETPRHSQLGEGIRPGMALGNHTVKRLLGKGGMGEVWLTTELVRDNDLYSVIKQPRPLTDPGQDTSKLLAIFHKVRLLQHEHICPIYSLGYDGRIGYYFVMKTSKASPWRNGSGTPYSRSPKVRSGASCAPSPEPWIAPTPGESSTGTSSPRRSCSTRRC